MRDENTVRDIYPEFYALSAENSELRSELAVLYEDFEYINRVMIPVIQTRYLINLGALRVDALCAQLSVMRTRRRIALLRLHLERGDRMRAGIFNQRLEREFRVWDERLKYETEQIDLAKARFSSLTPNEDEDEIRHLYRQLAKKLHPDINLDRGEEVKSLWPSVVSAYAWGNVFQLKSLLIIASDFPESYDLPCDMSSLRRNNAVLKENKQMMTAKIENLKQHQIFKWREILDDPELLSSEQRKLRQEIERARSQENALHDMLAMLERRGVLQ